MHRRIPWTELFSCTITSEASSLTLSEVENIFAAWRLVLKKMYLSRRIICFSGIDPLTPWNGLAGSFQCQWPFPKLRWFLKFQSYKILYDTARLWNIMEKCWAWSCYLSAGDVMYILLFLGRFAVVLLARAGRTWSAWSHKSLVDWMCGRTLPMATYVFSNLSDLTWPIEDGLGPFQYISSQEFTILFYPVSARVNDSAPLRHHWDRGAWSSEDPFEGSWI